MWMDLMKGHFSHWWWLWQLKYTNEHISLIIKILCNMCLYVWYMVGVSIIVCLDKIEMLGSSKWYIGPPREVWFGNGPGSVIWVWKWTGFFSLEMDLLSEFGNGQAFLVWKWTCSLSLKMDLLSEFGNGPASWVWKWTCFLSLEIDLFSWFKIGPAFWVW